MCNCVYISFGGNSCNDFYFHLEFYNEMTFGIVLYGVFPNFYVIKFRIFASIITIIFYTYFIIIRDDFFKEI